MKGVNKVMIIGALGADPDIRYTQHGDPVANLSVATNEHWKDKQGQKQERTEWHKVVAFKQPAQFLAEYAQKGSKVYIEGRLQTRKWQDKEGNDRYTTEIIAVDVQLLGDSGGSSRPADGGSKPSTSPKSPTQDDFDDDIPF